LTGDQPGPGPRRAGGVDSLEKSCISCDPPPAVRDGTRVAFPRPHTFAGGGGCGPGVDIGGLRWPPVRVVFARPPSPDLEPAAGGRRTGVEGRARTTGDCVGSP